VHISNELGNLCGELRSRHRRIVALDQPGLQAKADRIIAAAYALSCASVVVALNQLAGASSRPVAVDRKTVRLLASRASAAAMLDKIAYNIMQFNELGTLTQERRLAAEHHRFASELYNALDEANARLHRLAKPAAP